jgi:L-amino acid N-acyltransferase YncA
MELRPCNANDLPEICDIYNHYIANTTITFEEEAISVEELGSRVSSYTRSHPWLVCVVDKAVVGYAYARKWHERSAYRHSVEATVYIKHTETGKGYGRALYQKLFHDLEKLDCHVILGGIALPNEPSVRLHEYFGFTKVAHFHEVGWKFGQWVDVGYWQKTLAKAQPGVPAAKENKPSKRRR